MEKVIISSDLRDAFGVIKGYCGQDKLLMMRFFVEYHRGELSDDNSSLQSYLEIVSKQINPEEFMKLCLGYYLVELTPIQKAACVVNEYKNKANVNSEDDVLRELMSNRYYGASQVLDLWKESLK